MWQVPLDLIHKNVRMITDYHSLSHSHSDMRSDLTVIYRARFDELSFIHIEIHCEHEKTKKTLRNCDKFLKRHKSHVVNHATSSAMGILS
jgi:hypothetical protein